MEDHLTVTSIDTALTPISQAQRMLAEAKTLPQLKELRDYATGAKAWAKARGVGLGAENEAAEVIIRAERGIGEQLSALKEQGLYGPRVGGLSSRLLSSEEYIEQADGVSKRSRRLSPESAATIEGELAATVTLADIGISQKDAMNFQRAAAMPENEFEALIDAARMPLPDGTFRRLAKHDFYAKRRGAGAGAETPTNVGYDKLRAAYNALLTPVVGEDGETTFTSNAFLLMDVTELATAARYIKAMVDGYTEARSARG